jgi:hypothetical protein
MVETVSRNYAHNGRQICIIIEIQVLTAITKKIDVFCDMTRAVWCKYTDFPGEAAVSIFRIDLWLIKQFPFKSWYG